MPWSLLDLYQLLPAFLLVLFRISGLMLGAPLFSSVLLPMRFKAMLAVAMSLAVFPMTLQYVDVEVTLATAVGGLAGELAIGLFMGMGVAFLMMGVQMAGELISYQAGLALGAVFNPMLDTSSTSVSQLYFLVALVVFMAVGGDHALVTAVLDSFASVPPLAFRVSEELVLLVVELAAVSLSVAIRLGGPVIVALMLGFLTLGFISRTMPQLNILTIGFPMKLAIALMIMGLALMGLENVFVDGLTVCMDKVRAGVGLPATP